MISEREWVGGKFTDDSQVSSLGRRMASEDGTRKSEG